MTDHSRMKLGKLPRRYDPRTLQARKYLLTPLPPVKRECDWLSAVPSFPLYGNDVYSDCAIAAVGHMVQVWTANNKKPVVPSEDEILRVYRVLSPDDDGCVLLKVLNYWRQNSICGSKLGAFAEVNPRDVNEVNVCLDIFGGLYAGAMLPNAAKTQDIWDVTQGPEGIFGSWGGHCIPFGKYDAHTLRCVTWGAAKDATWPWLVEYVDELYALISPDWLDGAGKTPEGLDLATLQKDLELVTS